MHLLLSDYLILPAVSPENRLSVLAPPLAKTLNARPPITLSLFAPHPLIQRNRISGMSEWRKGNKVFYIDDSLFGFFHHRLGFSSDPGDYKKMRGGRPRRIFIQNLVFRTFYFLILKCENRKTDELSTIVPLMCDHWMVG